MLPIYSPTAADFTTNGLGLLTPLECVIEERAAGMYELTLTHPIDETLRWALIQPGCILKAPAPVRETPLYEAEAHTSPVTVQRRIWQVERTTHGAYLRSGPGTSHKKLAILKNGEQLIELEDCPDPWIKVCMVRGGAVGYMSTKWLGVKSVTEEVISPGVPTGTVRLTTSRDQLFRIYSVEQDSAAATVTARAMHIFYDASGNLIDGELSPKNQDVASVLASMNAMLAEDCPVTISCLNLAAPVTGDYGFKSPVEALLDPEGGIAAQTGALLVRDNYMATLISDNVRDRGVTIRRGKNLSGVQVEIDHSACASRILPVGRDKNGNPLYLEERYVDSPLAHPVPRIRRIEYDVQVGENGLNNATAVRNELRRLAKEEFSKNGADLPSYGMEVDFILLQNTDAYADYESLQAVHLYDTVTVIDETIGLKAKVKVTGYTFNCLTGQYQSVTLGELQSMEQTLYSYSIPDESLSGTKVIPGTLPGAALRSASIEYAKITSAAVKQLSADAITALTARIGEIVSGRLTTDELYAAYAELIALKAGTITAENIQTDALAAELARITVLAAGSASFDRATVQHLVADALNLQFGVAGQVFIQNLAVEYAQMVGAAIGELCIRASDGNYYILDVNPDGTVQATPTNVTDGELAAGQTSAGSIILETHISAERLNTGSLLSTYALINQIDAARIDVDQLFAREAFVDLLRTSRILGDESLTMIAQRVNQNFRQEDMPTSAQDVKTGDTWVIPSLGTMYQAEDAADLNLRFYLDEDGSLYYESGDEDELLSVEGYDLMSDMLGMSVTKEGEITGWHRWRVVTDLTQIEAAQDEIYFKQKELEAGQRTLSTYLRIDPEMVRIGRPGVTSEFQIDPWGAGVAINSRVFSRFEADRVRFGDMEIRRPAVGGLVFDSVQDLTEVNMLGN